MIKKFLRWLGCYLAKWTDNNICWDIAENREKELKKFSELVKISDNFRHRIPELQLESAIKDRFSVEKNNRIIIVLTFFLLVLTLVLVIKEIASNKKDEWVDVPLTSREINWLRSQKQLSPRIMMIDGETRLVTELPNGELLTDR